MKPLINLGWTDDRRPTHTRQGGRSTTIFLQVTLAVLWLICYYHYKTVSARDPTSFFFDEKRGYERIYSSKRAEEAYRFVEDANRTDFHATKSSASPSMCIGVATITRPEQYVRQAVGSLLEGLSEKERSEIFLILFIAHTDPVAHPIYHEPWTQAVAEKVLTYDGVTPDEISQLRFFEEEHHPRNKSMFDYGYLLDNCLKTGAKWITILEDDVVARGGWYAQASQSLQVIDGRMGNEQWLYMRMFYTESLLGWNSDEWPKYVTVSALLAAGVAGSLFGFRGRSPLLRRYLSNLDLALTLAYLPAFIALYFMAGRVTVQPPASGVRPMPRYGCCSQGFIFPSTIVPQVIERTRKAMFEDYYVDMLLERFAEAGKLTRFAHFPSLLQHVGLKSSKGYGFDGHAGEIWNFGFELYESK